MPETYDYLTKILWEICAVRASICDAGIKVCGVTDTSDKEQSDGSLNRLLTTLTSYVGGLLHSGLVAK